MASFLQFPLWLPLQRMFLILAFGLMSLTISACAESGGSGSSTPGGGPAPGGPLPDPFPPCPLRRIFVPVSAPAGTAISTFLRVRTSPAPLQVGQRSLGTCPRPMHMGHGRLTAKPP